MSQPSSSTSAPAAAGASAPTGSAAAAPTSAAQDGKTSWSQQKTPQDNPAYHTAKRRALKTKHPNAMGKEDGAHHAGAGGFAGVNPHSQPSKATAQHMLPALVTAVKKDASASASAAAGAGAAGATPWTTNPTPSANIAHVMHVPHKGTESSHSDHGSSSYLCSLWSAVDVEVIEYDPTLEVCMSDANIDSKFF
jgi:hypothetical protein